MSTAIVTGASTGFGRALAIELARNGWDLVIDARTDSDLGEAAAAIADEGSRVRAIRGDVTNPAHVAELVEIASEPGDLALLVNNAGALGPSPQPSLAEYPSEVLADVFAANVIAPLRITQLALPALRRTAGSIVNITSDAAIEAYEGWGGYGSSKAALEQLSSVLAAEEPEVRVYWFDPGDMNTRMHQAAFPEEDISDRPDPSQRAPALVRLIQGDFPSGRYQAEELLAETVDR